MKILINILLFFSIISCGSFEKTIAKNQKLDPEKINGFYNIFAVNNEKKDSYYFDNANENFYHKYGRGERDTLKFDTITGGKFQINVLNKKQFSVSFIRNNTIVRKQILNYKLKENWLFVKNKNILIAGVPFIFGGIDVKKIRLGISDKNNLIINSVYESSGALLLIIGDSKRWEYINEYDRID